MSDLRPLLTLPEVADRLKVSVSTLRAWRAHGYLNVVKLPSGTVRVTPEEYERITEPARSPQEER